MKNRLVLILAGMLAFSFTAEAQKYITAAGLRVEKHRMGLTVQQRVLPKSTIEFLGLRIAVKNGAARLAAALRTPILPVIALRDGVANGRLVFGEPHFPPAGLKHSENEKFAQTTMQSIIDAAQK